MIGGSTPPDRYKEWIGTLPEYQGEVTGYVVINMPISDYVGIVALFEHDTQTIHKIRPFSANVSYRVNELGVMTYVENIEVASIKNVAAPNWRTGNTMNVSINTENVIAVLNQPLE